MLLPIVGKAVEASAKEVFKKTEYAKPNGISENGGLEKTDTITDLEKKYPTKTVFQPDVEKILNQSLQEVIENSKEKIQEIREKFLKDNDEVGNKVEDSENNNSEPDENIDNEELTDEEINENQIEAIKEAFGRILKGENLTNEELGNLGEMMMDQYYIAKGYKPLNKHRVTCLEDKKEGFKTGIDGVYEKTNPDGTKSYVIADAKYNTSKLSETNDGKQMSDNWIDKRLDDAVGKEKADEIRDTAEDDPNAVKHEIYHIDPNIDEAGNTHADTQEVDSEGNKIGEKTIVEYFDSEGNRIAPSPKE